jgi:hypothetical protein
MTTITFPDDVTGAIQIAHGSDGRLNVSSRSDERIYYNSRDEGQTYIWTSFDSAAAADEYSIYLQNTSTSKNLIIKDIRLSPGVAMTFKIATVTGTAGGSAITGYNLNRNSGNDASANAWGDAAVTGLTEAQVITTEMVSALTTKEIDFHDALILGQNDNIAVECDVNAGGLVYIQIIGYFE